MQSATTSLLVLKELAGHSAPHLDQLQQFLALHITTITSFWFSVWCMTAIVLLAKLWYEYKEQKNNGDL
jgi:hypothetical protein